LVIPDGSGCQWRATNIVATKQTGYCLPDPEQWGATTIVGNSRTRYRSPDHGSN
jgi:hypothetical protein